MTQKLKMGMVGGGRDAFIGGVHRMAARLDGEIELVAGAFSSDPEKAKRSGEDLSLESERVYGDYQTMVETEARLPVGKRIDFVSIVTPNHLHFPIAKLFLEAGFNVVCDKPMTFASVFYYGTRKSDGQCFYAMELVGDTYDNGRYQRTS